jgi:hypothetical protein
VIDERSFLRTVAGYTKQASPGDSAGRPDRLATIDPAYSGAGAPKVTFDGESTLSSKLYAYADSYRPAAGDRVLLVPIGTTYMIVGKVASGETKTPGGVLGYASGTTGQTLSGGQTTPTDITGLSVTFPVVTGRRYRITARLEVSSTVANDAVTIEIADGINTRLQRCDRALSAATVASSVRDELIETYGSAGNITRKLRFFRSAGTGNPSVVAASNNIAFILVEDIGGV